MDMNHEPDETFSPRKIRLRYRLRSVLQFFRSAQVISLRRLCKGARLPGWNWTLEVMTHFLKAQTRISFDMPRPADGREYDDALIFASAAVAKVRITPVRQPVRGHWYVPKAGARDVTVLYLHGGGYAYYSQAHHNLIALATLAARASTFALDYRLIPEHPYPAQLLDALGAYRWLLQTGVEPGRLVVMGDSAGGNLTLALLLELRDAGLPLPALGVCIAPWTDVGNSGDSLTRNEPFDWVEKRMPVQWAQWFLNGADPRDPVISPIQADLTGLPPIYIQAGDAEILFDMIQAFADRAREQGAEVQLEVWKNMNHDFQAYGDLLPQSKEALEHIGRFIDETLRR
jgi:monoterpene epsilon-lactone hydrolase